MALDVRSTGPLSFRFHKSERLKSNKQIEELLARGRSVKGYPLRALFLTSVQVYEGQPMQVAFTVPKRTFRRAVDRNLLKRRMREAYRLNKSQLAPLSVETAQQISVLFIYTSRDILSFEEVQKGMIKALRRIARNFQED